MKQFYFLMTFLFVSGAVFAQETMTKEERQRRENNIQAANPFAKYGYKAKVATLSKGKYLEVHDLDSIVTIGSIRFHVDKKRIVGIVAADTVNGEYARPIGDMPSRWLSVDPLAEEFPSWSPYTFSYNNPIRYVDPDGRAADDWRNKDGNLIYDPKANGGKGAYTEHATKNDKNIGNALQLTATGRAQFDKLVNSAQPTEIVLDNGKGPIGEAGKTKNINPSMEIDLGTGQATGGQAEKSVITVYMGTIGDLAEADKNGNVGKLNGTPVNGLNYNQIVGAVVGHEIEHTTSDNIILQQSNATVKQIEATPTNVSNKIIKESLELNKQ